MPKFPMLKIKKITVENFRGIRLPISIDFSSNKPTSVVLYGRNGTGKSSIVDAWEWLHDFVVKHLDKEGITPRDYPHKASDGVNCRISIEFFDQDLDSLSAEFNREKIKSPTLSGDHAQFRYKSKYPNYLRAADLQEFVYLTKTEKYSYIAKFFGLEEFTAKQSLLRTGLSKVENLLAQYKNRRDRAVSELRKTLNDSAAPMHPGIVLETLNLIATKYEVPQISSFTEHDKIRDGLELIINNNPTAKSLAEWTTFQQGLKSYFPFPETCGKARTLDETISTLKSSEKNVTELILLQLYENAINSIETIGDPFVCPVCDQAYQGDLVKHLRVKHKMLDALNKAKNDFEEKRNELGMALKLVAESGKQLARENSEEIRNELYSLFQLNASVNESLPTVIGDLRKYAHQPMEADFAEREIFKIIDAIHSSETEVKTKVQNRISLLSSEAKTISLAQDFRIVNDLIDGFIKYKRNTAKFAYLLTTHEDYQKFYEKLTSHIQLQIQETFSDIQNDVMDYFHILEDSNEQFRNPKIKLVEGRDKAVELEIEFVNETVTPAFKFMSESQVNSFGLSIFLAAVKHFNRDFRFIILDDVINSFDDYKRPRVPNLLQSRFADFQIFLLTHDQIFFETIQRTFPSWKRFKFNHWDYEIGPNIQLARSYIEDIEEDLKNDNPIGAGQKLGRYLEWILGVLSDKLKVPIPFKLENIYTLAELYDPFVSRLREKLKSKDKVHRIISRLDNLEQGTMFRNYCAHWKGENTQFSTPEIRDVFTKWLKIEESFFCDQLY